MNKLKRLDRIKTLPELLDRIHKNHGGKMTAPEHKKLHTLMEPVPGQMGMWRVKKQSEEK